MTKVRIPTRIMPDYTLVKFADSFTYTTQPGFVIQVPNQHSRINFNIHANDLYAAGAPISVVSQPTGYNEWMNFYVRSIVHKCSIRVTPIYWQSNDGEVTDSQAPFQITITPIAYNVVNAGLVDFEEQPYERHKVFTSPMPIRTTSGITTIDMPSSVMPYVYNSIMMKKIGGVKDLSDDLNWSATRAASPNNKIYWNIDVKSMIPSMGVTDIFRLQAMGLKIDLFYKAQLTERFVPIDNDEA